MKINTQGRVPKWFKSVEHRLIEDPLTSKKVKSIYQLEYTTIEDKANINDLKSRNWIAEFSKQMNKAIIERILNKPDCQKVMIEHWVQEITSDKISPSLQLPIIKRCGGCEIKTDHITMIDLDKSVKINASIQN